MLTDSSGEAFPAGRLTERELEILGLLAEGLSNRQIAERLTLAVTTVKWYARQIYTRLGVEDRHQAVARAADLGLLAGPAGSSTPPHNLPSQATPFVGRQRELARLDRWLSDPAVRLVTITGPGGMGKTRLALAAAGRQIQQAAPTHPYPDGIWFVPLAGMSHASRLAPAFAASLGFQFNPASRTDTEAQLFDYLRARRCLLVVDNFEHLLEGAGFLAELVAAAAGVKLLVTSRERLQLQGEQLLALEGLELPQEGAEVEAILDAAAARLFLNTARRVQPEFELGEADMLALDRICRVVGGAPLAIELAAAWATALPPAEIAAGIERGLDFLSVEVRDRPARHQSIQAALDASWVRLPAEQQVAFQRLCVFRGGFTRAAALEATGTPLPLLVQLVSKSWLSYDQKADRYRIHELARQYGRQHLTQDPDREREALDRHSAYYTALLQQRAADFGSGRQKEWVGEMQVELPNIEQAWEWAIQAGDAEKIGRSLESLARFYQWTGRLADSESAMGVAAQRLAELAQAQPSERELLRIWANTLIWQSRIVREMGRRLHLLQEAQDLLDRLPAGYPKLQADRAFFLRSSGNCAFYHDRLKASDLYQQALALYRELGDSAGTAACLFDLGSCDWARGRFDPATQHLEASLAIRRDLGDRRGMAEVLDILALVRKHQGRTEEAEKLQREVIDSYRLLGSRPDEMIATATLAHTMAESGKYQEMLELAYRAAAIANELGGGDEDGYIELTIAKALQHLGHYQEARALLPEAAKAARGAGFLQHLGFALCWLGEITLIGGDYGQAKQLLIESEAIFAGLEQNVLATPVAWLSYAYRAEGESEKAEQCLARAVALALDRRSVPALRDCLPVAGLLLVDRANLERAAELHALSQTFPSIANSRWFYDATGRELEEKIARLPVGLAEAAAERGRQLDWWQTAEALAATLSQP